MKNFPVIALLLILLGSNVNAQVTNRCSYKPPRQAENWLFYRNAGLTFNDGSVIQNDPPGNNLQNGNSCAAISDADGNLIAYSNGFRVWNSNHNVINNGPNLPGDLGAGQCALFVPKPGSAQMVYLFTNDINTGNPLYPRRGLNYARIDMTLYDNSGGVTDERDRLLLLNSTEMIAGCGNADTTGFWVVSHGLDNNSFYAFLVDHDGVSNTPVISNAGSVISGDAALQESRGVMKISPKGDKIAYSSLTKGIIEVFSFNNQTGVVSNIQQLTPPIPGSGFGPLSIEFSPDGTKLYTTVINISIANGNKLYQYDLASNSGFVELNPAPMASDMVGLQLATDGKIYAVRFGAGFLGTIENPNRPGTECNYNEFGLSLGSKTGSNGLPNFISSFLNIPPVDYDTKCDGDGTVFKILNESNIDQVTWDFGDSGDPTPGSGLNPVHTFSTFGDYSVTMTEIFNGQSFVTTFPVHIDSLPVKSFDHDSLYIFPGSSIDLFGPPDMYSYLWQDASAAQYFKVTDPGIYSVEYVDINCCMNRDTLTVTALDIALPNAFTPNSDNINDVFRPLGPTDGIQDFALSVHNRWGQVVWETKNFEDAWDGTFNGEPMPRGIYAWNMSFNVKGNIMDIGKVKYRGVVTILK
jgi:gliding motility-associated-like protein